MSGADTAGARTSADALSLADFEAEPEPDFDAHTEPGPEPDSHADARPEPEPDPQPQHKSEPQPDPEPQPLWLHESEPDRLRDADGHGDRVPAGEQPVMSVWVIAQMAALAATPSVGLAALVVFIRSRIRARDWRRAHPPRHARPKDPAASRTRPGRAADGAIAGR